jgi:hypothetical protein
MRVPVQLCLAALAAAGLLAACSGAPPAAAPAAPVATISPPEVTAGAAASTDAPTAVAGWSCDAVRNATLGSSTVAYEPASQPITFSNGSWSNEAGSVAQVKECAVGDLAGTGPDDAIAAVDLRPFGASAEYWTLGVWHDTAGTATFVTLTELGDRNPVENVTISGTTATVVWDTRGPTDPMAVLSIRRTSVYALIAGGLTEVSHIDVPYTA